MKKYLVLSIVMVTGLVILQAQPGIDEKHREYIIKNNIESQMQLDKSFMKGKLHSPEQKTAFTRYNTNGKVIEMITYQSKDTLTLETYDYNHAGFRTEYTRRKGGALVITYKKNSEYDKNGNLLVEKGYNGTENFVNKFEYNDKGKLTEIRYYLEGRLDEKRTFTHEGNHTRVEIFNAGGKLVSSLMMIYDEDENLLEERLLDNTGQVTENKIYEYDNTGLLRNEKKYRGDVQFYSIDYRYSSTGDLTEIIEDNPTDEKFIKKSYSYDGKNNIAEMKWRRGPEDDFSTKTYNYNKKGICTGVVTYFPSTDFKVITKYTYEFR